MADTLEFNGKRVGLVPLEWCSLSLLCTEFVKEAVKEDEAGNFEKALSLYLSALQYFQTHLKYEKNPQAHAAIKAKVGASGLVSPVKLFAPLIFNCPLA